MGCRPRRARMLAQDTRALRRLEVDVRPLGPQRTARLALPTAITPGGLYAILATVTQAPIGLSSSRSARCARATGAGPRLERRVRDADLDCADDAVDRFMATVHLCRGAPDDTRHPRARRGLSARESAFGRSSFNIGKDGEKNVDRKAAGAHATSTVTQRRQGWTRTRAQLASAHHVRLTTEVARLTFPTLPSTSSSSQSATRRSAFGGQTKVEQDVQRRDGGIQPTRCGRSYPAESYGRRRRQPKCRTSAW